jgi:hypothetical protein
MTQDDDDNDEPTMCANLDDRWVIDHAEYLGLVKVLIRARAVVRSFQRNGDGSVRIPPRAAGDLRVVLKEFSWIDQTRGMPCRVK